MFNINISRLSEPKFINGLYESYPKDFVWSVIRSSAIFLKSVTVDSILLSTYST